jgi:hypothetical protein
VNGEEMYLRYYTIWEEQGVVQQPWERLTDEAKAVWNKLAKEVAQ